MKPTWWDATFTEKCRLLLGLVLLLPVLFIWYATRLTLPLDFLEWVTPKRFLVEE